MEKYNINKRRIDVSNTISIPGGFYIPPGVIVLKKEYFEENFEKIYNLKSVSFPSGIININGRHLLDSSILSCLIIIKGIKNIMAETFMFTNLKYVNIICDVKNIENKAFYCCYSLASVILPNNLVKIGNSAFEKCKSLKSIMIPNSVNEIGTKAFAYCENLEIILDKDLTEINLGKDCFLGVKKLRILENSLDLKKEKNKDIMKIIS